MKLTFPVVCLLAALALSCSSTPKSPAPPIRVGGETRSLNALVGRWEGVYTNPANGRTGTIVLEFLSGKEAHGDILMIPPGSTDRKPSAEETLRTMPRVLEINFIQAAGDELSGTVGPYEDPDSHCAAHTAFQGTLRGDTIEGSFRTECLDSHGKSDANMPATTGSWRVSRKKSGAAAGRRDMPDLTYPQGAGFRAAVQRMVRSAV
jgi:hypothetical protein